MKLSINLTSLIVLSVFSVAGMAQQSASGEVTEKCTYPQQPAIPNGTKADMDEMLEAQSAVKKYQTSAQDFRNCIDGVMATWKAAGGDEEQLSQKTEIAVSFYNRSVADEEEVANMFNRAREAFLAKRK